MVSKWGNRYGWGILNQQLITDSTAEKLIGAFASRPNSLAQTESSLEQFLQEADQQRKNKSPIKKVKISSLKDVDIPLEKYATEEEDSTHSKAQGALITLGIITGCQVWVASNDRNRSFNGKTLGNQCLKQLPNMGLSDEAARKISLIDIIWVKQNSPVCAFEVETTTSIYSGILRMSDLLSLVPAINIKLYIVAPRERQDKVGNELTRPTFREIGLNDKCKFIPLEELNGLLAKVEDFGGHIQPTIIDKIAIGFLN